MIRTLLKKVPGIYPLYRALLEARERSKQFNAWRAAGSPLPPPHIIKQIILRRYARRYRLKTFIETGTLYGDMVEALKDVFTELYSIELGVDLHRKAQERFKHEPHIHIIQGDSGEVLGAILPQVRSPALFWLDGHYSAGVTAKGKNDTPIFEELEHIFAAQRTRDIIIIDDARCFGSDPAYPTQDALRAFILAHQPDREIKVQDDMIIITPSK